MFTTTYRKTTEIVTVTGKRKSERKRNQPFVLFLSHRTIGSAFCVHQSLGRYGRPPFSIEHVCGPLSPVLTGRTTKRSSPVAVESTQCIGSQRSTSGRLERVPEESALGIRLLFTLFSRTDFADCVTAPGGAPYLRLVIASPRRRVLWTYMIRNTGGGSFERCRFICASTKQ